MATASCVPSLQGRSLCPLSAAQGPAAHGGAGVGAHPGAVAAAPSAALRPLPHRAGLCIHAIGQQQVGADGFPQAQADGGVLLSLPRRWHSL